MAAADQETHVSSVRPRSYQDESYQHGFLGAVGDLQKEGELQDVVLEVEGRRFPCHRLVLSAASPYFRAMFTRDMAESRQNTVVLQGLDADMFEDILSYIYSGTLHVSLDRVQPQYQAADLLQLDYVRDTCSSYMAMNVEISTCVDLYKFAEVFRVDVVLNRCLQYICQHFVEVSSSEEFCSLSVDQLTEIISQDKLEIKEETSVWEAVVRWVQHSREDRLQHLPSILPHIRFNLLTSDDTAAILEHPLVREDHGSSEAIRNLVQTRNPKLRPRIGMTTEMVLLSNIETVEDEILYMNPQEGMYISCSEDLPDSSMVTVTRDNDIYTLVNGRDESTYYQLSMLKYNHADNVWEDAGMSSVSGFQREDSGMFTHQDECLLEVDGILHYLAADLGEVSALVRMKKYDQRTDQWQDCSQLLLDGKWDDGTAVSCGSYIYFLMDSAMHRYNPSQDCWCELTPPNLWCHLRWIIAAAMGTEIFCTNFHFTVTMVYDTESDCWRELPGWPNPGNHSINHVRKFFVLNNQLHVFLETFDTDKQRPTRDYRVYVYDRSADAWRDLKATLPNIKKQYYATGPMCPVARIYIPYLKGAQKHITCYARLSGDC